MQPSKLKFETEYVIFARHFPETTQDEWRRAPEKPFPEDDTMIRVKLHTMVTTKTGSHARDQSHDIKVSPIPADLETYWPKTEKGHNYPVVTVRAKDFQGESHEFAQTIERKKAEDEKRERSDQEDSDANDRFVEAAKTIGLDIVKRSWSRGGRTFFPDIGDENRVELQAAFEKLAEFGWKYDPYQDPDEAT